MTFYRIPIYIGKIKVPVVYLCFSREVRVLQKSTLDRVTYVPLTVASILTAWYYPNWILSVKLDLKMSIASDKGMKPRPRKAGLAVSLPHSRRSGIEPSSKRRYC